MYLFSIAYSIWKIAASLWDQTKNPGEDTAREWERDWFHDLNLLFLSNLSTENNILIMQVK